MKTIFTILLLMLSISAQAGYKVSNVIYGDYSYIIYGGMNQLVAYQKDGQDIEPMPTHFKSVSSFSGNTCRINIKQITVNPLSWIAAFFSDDTVFFKKDKKGELEKVPVHQIVFNCSEM